MGIAAGLQRSSRAEHGARETAKNFHSRVRFRSRRRRWRLLTPGLAAWERNPPAFPEGCGPAPLPPPPGMVVPCGPTDPASVAGRCSRC